MNEYEDARIGVVRGVRTRDMTFMSIHIFAPHIQFKNSNIAHT